MSSSGNSDLQKRLLNKVRKEIEAYTKEWVTGLEEPGNEELKARVHCHLDSELKRLMLAAAGFEADYSGYRLSNSKDSPARRFLQEEVAQHTQEWIKTNLALGFGLSVDEKLQKQLQRVYSRYYKERLFDEIADLAQEHAQEDAEKLFPSLMKKLRATDK